MVVACSVQETHKVLLALQRMSDVGNLRCDLGQLLRVCEKAVETTALDFNGAVAEEVKVITIGPGLKNQMNVARDIVLYGFGRIGRLLARELIRKTGSGNKMRLRGIVVRPQKRVRTWRNVRNCSRETLCTVNLTAVNWIIKKRNDY